jgi:hypothetical protein
MNMRRPASILLSCLALPIVLSLAGCSALISISILPVAGSVVLTAVGQTEQYSAFGQQQVGSAPSTTQNITNSVTWSAGNSAVATISATGLATAVGPGTTTITAESNGITASSDLTVTIAAGGTGGSTQLALLSINIVPGGTTVSNKGMTGQYLAFGTYSQAPVVRDLTNQVTWISLAPEVVSISSSGVTGEIGGLATAEGYTGNGVIYAQALSPDGSVILSNPQTFTCVDPITNACNQNVAHPQFATLTVFNAGSNTTTWSVTAPSDTGVANLIHCGPGATGASVCTGTYETGTTVTLTESPTGTGFGGWSSGDGGPGIGCTPANGTTLLTSPTCTVTLNGNTSVGAIFY